MKTDVVIIGSGLIGSMAAKYLRDLQGMEVVIIDQVNPMSASKCSFGVWKEGWVNKVIAKEYENGYDLLDTFTGGIVDEEFLVKPKPYNAKKFGSAKYEVNPEIKKETFKRADCSLILNEKFIEATVLSIEDNRVTIVHPGKEKRKELIVAKHIIVAAGVWTTDILINNGLVSNLPYLDFYWGSVFRLKMSEKDMPASQMKEWAPYKQSVWVNQGGGRALFGDGAVIKNPVKDDARLSPVSDRIAIHMNELLGSKKYIGNIVEILEGYRPYLNKEKSLTGKFVNRHSQWVISATGGAKNSTVLCGHMAKEIYREMKNKKNK